MGIGDHATHLEEMNLLVEKMTSANRDVVQAPNGDAIVKNSVDTAASDRLIVLIHELSKDHPILNHINESLEISMSEVKPSFLEHTLKHAVKFLSVEEKRASKLSKDAFCFSK